MYKGLLLFTFSHFLKIKKKFFINNNNYIKKNNAKSIHFNFYLFNHSTFFIIYFVVFCSLSRNENKIYNLILFDRVLGPIIYCEIIGIHGGLVFVDIMGRFIFCTETENRLISKKPTILDKLVLKNLNKRFSFYVVYLFFRVFQ